MRWAPSEAKLTPAPPQSITADNLFELTEPDEGVPHGGKTKGAFEGTTYREAMERCEGDLIRAAYEQFGSSRRVAKELAIS